MDEFLHLLLPPIINLYSNCSREVPLNVAKAAMETVELLSLTMDFTDYSAAIIHPLVSIFAHVLFIKLICVYDLLLHELVFLTSVHFYHCSGGKS